MKIFALIFALAAIAASIFAQSGRIKPNPSPSPKPKNDPVIITSSPRPRIVDAKPTPTPADNSNDDEIRIESILIPIPALILDKSGKAVTNLALEDFELRINGEAVTFSKLERTDVPLSLSLLLDNSSSVRIAREFERNAAARFFRRVIRENKDQAALFAISTQPRLVQPMTGKISDLIRAVNSLPEPDGATALLDGIVSSSKYLGEQGGRRILVIVSDGDDTVSDAEFDDALKAVIEKNCQTFIVRTTDYENYKLTKNRRGNENIRQLIAEKRMGELAKQTGGEVFSPIDDAELESSFDRIIEILYQQYILAYYPDISSLTAGRYNTIQLAVRGRPDLKVITRSGFYLPKRS
jgi:Ca-activated chloride channel family protein